MGYFKVENFDDAFTWQASPVSSRVSLFETEFDHLKANPDKARTVGITTTPGYDYSVDITKKLPKPVFFKFKDVYDKYVTFDTIRLTYSADLGYDVRYKSPQDFRFTFYISYKGVVLAEWLMPLVSSNCKYSYIDFDLLPLHDEFTAFDEIGISSIRDSGNTKILLGEIYLVQCNDITHNIKLALADLLNLKKRELLTTLSDYAPQGAKRLKVDNTTDIHRGTTVCLGHPDETIKEVHRVESVVTTSTKRGAFDGDLEFGMEFDGDTSLYSWGTGTPVYRVIPAIITDLLDAEAIFPLYYIYCDVETTDDDAGFPKPVVDSFRVLPTGKCESSVRKGMNHVTLRVSVNIFADVPEIAEEMWNFLRSKVDVQSHLYVAGEPFQYTIEDERAISPESGETLPNYIMELTFYYQHNVYERVYRPFPRFEGLRAAIDLIPVEVRI